MPEDWITLNVGGRRFTTTRSTLINNDSDSMLAKMFSSCEDKLTWQANAIDSTGAFLIDRSGEYFEPILNYLRHGKLVLNTNINPRGVLEEAKFFGISSLVEKLEKLVEKVERPKSRNSDIVLNRRDAVIALISSSSNTELRFQGTNFEGADLSRLDLRYVNFKLANLRGVDLSAANLSCCCLERVDLSSATLDGANLMGVKMLCANLEGASLKKCNFEDPAGSKALLEGVNLKDANLEGCTMAGVNLRVANLKNANMRNCDLSKAVLAGADLENCVLSGSDLHEANLRGANLNGVNFQSMMTPIHMAQTIR